MSGSKADILAALRGQTPAQLPVSLLGGGAWTMVQNGIGFREAALDPVRLAGAIVSTARRLGRGIVFVGGGFNNALPAALARTELVWPDPSPPVPARILPVDPSIRCRVKELAQSRTVETVQEATRRVADRLGDQFPVTMVSWGPFTVAGQVFGPQALLRLCLGNPGLLRSFTAMAQEAVLEFYRPVLDSVDIVYLAEPLASGDLISPRMFAEFVAEPLSELFSSLTGGGERSGLLHICGRTADRLQAVARIRGLSAFSFDSLVSLALARDGLAGLGMGGNIDPLLLYGAGPSEIRAGVQRALAELREHRGFVLMPGCDLAPATPWRNIEAFLSVTDEH